jgi:mannobiose 2-epimerase
MSHAREGETPDLREHLLTRVLPFWADHSVDQDCGGFITHLARDGAITDRSEKFVVMQARMIYGFATGAALGGPREWLNFARQGASFLLQRFRDFEHDGWYWSVSRQGAPRDTSKRMYGHAFAVYALAEYGRLARDGRALGAASHCWSLTEDCLWDRDGEGVFEVCSRDWKLADRRRTMGTHLHTLEALLALHEATGDARCWPRARAICDLVATRMVEAEERCALEKFGADWTHDVELSRGLVDYGHNLEAAWLLLRVHQAEDSPAYRDTARCFLDYVLKFGLDAKHGGVFSHGPIGQPATVREKIWWVQTEALVAFLLAHLVFGEEKYLDAFRNVWDFCMKHLHDPEYGEWYHATAEEGTPRDTSKGSAWKAAYHITQALAYGHDYLSQIAAR